METGELDNSEGDIPVAEVGSELWAYSTQGCWADQEEGLEETKHCSVVSRLPFLQGPLV